ncbi:MAG: P-II family nitrogen regulator [Bacilli bacterium]
MNNKKDFDLLVIIVKKGYSEKVVKTAQAVGAKGSTVINGRGSSVHENKKILGVPIEPEKEIILIVVEDKDTDRILNEIISKVELNKPGVGIGFVLDVERVVGIHEGND